MRFFFYGTLRDEAVREAVMGPVRARALSVVPASLAGWRCVFVHDRVYPAIIAESSSVVAGVVAEGVDREGYRRLTDFESDEYVERTVHVTTAGGDGVDAIVYAAGPRTRLSSVPWDFDEWVRDHRDAFLRRIGGVTL
jgi:gamma-glutamylcyclotransferase (GGCT)/AIG2-like uncharacterized protein YtfP